MSSVRSLRTSPLVTIPVDRLRSGIVLGHSLLEDHPTRRTVLLPAGTTLTAQHLQVFVVKNVRNVQIDRSEFDAVTIAADVPEKARRVAGSPNRLETEEDDSGQNPWTVNANSLLHQVPSQGTKPYDPADREKFLARYNDTVAAVEAMYLELVEGDVRDIRDLQDVTATSIAQITTDPDLFAALGVSPVDSGYPSRHSVQTAMLAMSIGTKLGLHRDELQDLGVGCLIHDAGMLHLDKKIVTSTNRLDKMQFLEITKHPVITYDLMKKVHGVPVGTRMVAYQMHERCDGSGYPRGRTGRQIHPLARIAAVADVFVALVSGRPHRIGRSPYEAVVHLLEGVRQGQFDRYAVRGLLRAVSLFPVGSCIETTDGTRARVLRTNSDYTRPVVERIDDDLAAVLDLSAMDGVRIARAIASPRGEWLPSGPAVVEEWDEDPEKLALFWL